MSDDTGGVGKRPQGRSRVVRAVGGGWEGVPEQAYAASTEAGGDTSPTGAPFRDVARHVLFGGAAGEDALRFEVRYFEIGPGGHSSRERHAHPHAVVVLRGRGTVELDGEVHELGAFDAVHVAPWSIHQFRAAPDAPLGFLCVVDRERDRPERLPDP